MIIAKLQDISSSLKDMFLSCIRILFLATFRTKLPAGDNDKTDCVILANGPSLNASLPSIEGFCAGKAKLCVNYFALSPYYEVIQPDHYVLNAPEFFIQNPPTPQHTEARLKLFSLMADKTKWPINLFVPLLAKKFSFWKEMLVSNSNISVYYYNSAPVEGPRPFVNFIFSKNLGMPRPHNVLIPSIFLALNMHYKNIYLLGADHSWHEEIKVDDTNQVTVNHEHFYDMSKQQAPMHKLGGHAYYVHDVFRKLYLAFKGYHILKVYAKSLGKNVFNASKKSYIDAFEKIKI